MSHSTVIALALFALYLVYITAKGELPQYLAVIAGPFPTNTPPPAAATTAASLASTAGQAVNLATGTANLLQQGANLLSPTGAGSLDIGGDGGELDIGGS